MKAYVIAIEAVHDEAMFAKYREQVAGTLVPFGGLFIARGGKWKPLEGQWPHPRTVIIEFPTREAAEAWYKSPDYQKIIGLRHESSSGNHSRWYLTSKPSEHVGCITSASGTFETY